jgi:multidrug efflux pump
MITPSLLAMRVWATTYVLWFASLLAKLSLGRASKSARDWALQKQARKASSNEGLWDFDEDQPSTSIKPAE